MSRAGSQSTARCASSAILWVTVSFLAALAPHALRLPPWITATVAAIAAWRLAIAYRRWRAPAGWLRLALTALATAGVLAQYGTIVGRQPGVALLALMTALKLLETARQRDAMLMAVLGYFVVVSQFLFSQSLSITGYLAAVVVLITATLIHINDPFPHRRAGAQLRQAGKLLTQALPLTLVLFVLFPRLSSPMWGAGRADTQGQTGLSDSMSPGSISELVIDDSPAFRVHFRGERPARAQRYWRGPVLWHYDGTTWERDWNMTHTRAQPVTPTPGEGYRYRIAVEPHDNHWVFGLDRPTAAVGDGEVAITRDRQVVTRDEIRQTRSFELRSRLGFSAARTLDKNVRRKALELPEDSNPRAKELGAEWAAQERDSDALVERALSYFRQERFEYSYNPPLLGRHGMDTFLFETRSGFCEHYASAFAVLMRAAGVPTRIVIGYQGGFYNRLGDYVVVRQSDAHAWAEVWLPERGWSRVDPTAAVSPQRVASGLSSAIAERRSLFDYPVLREMRATWDAAHTFWNDWVLEYNADRQARLLTPLGLGELSLRGLVLFLAAAAAIVLTVVAVLVLRGPRRAPESREQRAYARFRRKLTRAGVVPELGEAPWTLAERATHALPRHRAAIRAITHDYVALRYAGRRDPAIVHRLLREVRGLRLAPQRPRWRNIRRGTASG